MSVIRTGSLMAAALVFTLAELLQEMQDVGGARPDTHSIGETCQQSAWSLQASPE
jgi:hypothetical protein